MQHFASEIFLNKINEKWPDRNKRFDLFEKNVLTFHPSLDGKKTTTKLLLSELVDYLKNENKDFAISFIVYKNKKCSGHHKEKFWVWEDDGTHEDDLVRIGFKETKTTPQFDIPLFRKPKKNKKNTVEFPGIKSLQYKRRNRHVKNMQTRLIQIGFLINEKEIGYYGKDTCEAVKAYYRKVLGINSGTIVKDGKKFGPKAWERLFS